MSKVLIVEDVALNLDLLVQLLEDDYALVSAVDGQSGIELAAAERPDLILMDMSLPVMDGWTATRELKANPALAHIPIIGLSAHAMEGDRQKALDDGCDAYLTKPVDADLLLDMIEKMLKKE
ncbi:MAG: response regulator [Anaerolineales bacterium]|nr:MAG: response regulator [Anaerolineales bacterium]